MYHCSSLYHFVHFHSLVILFLVFFRSMKLNAYILIVPTLKMLVYLSGITRVLLVDLIVQKRSYLRSISKQYAIKQ